MVPCFLVGDHQTLTLWTPISSRMMPCLILTGSPLSHLSVRIFVCEPFPICFVKPPRQSWIDLQRSWKPQETLPNLILHKAMLTGESLYLAQRTCDIKDWFELWILKACFVSKALLNRWAFLLPKPPPPFGSSRVLILFQNVGLEFQEPTHMNVAKTKFILLDVAFGIRNTLRILRLSIDRMLLMRITRPACKKERWCQLETLFSTFSPKGWNFWELLWPLGLLILKLNLRLIWGKTPNSRLWWRFCLSLRPRMKVCLVYIWKKTKAS